MILRRDGLTLDGAAKVEGGGDDVILDFDRGADLLALGEDRDGAMRLHGAGRLDSNGDGDIDGDDRHVDLVELSVDGVTRLSLRIDVAGLAQGDWHGSHTVTLFGQTLLNGSDFAETEDAPGILMDSFGTSLLDLI